MEKLTFSYPAQRKVTKRVHVGVVASGDLEVLLEPVGADAAGGTSAKAGDAKTGEVQSSRSQVTITTSVDGFGPVWKNVLDRFFNHFNGAVSIEINDFGATPGLVMLRLEQAAEALQA